MVPVTRSVNVFRLNYIISYFGIFTVTYNGFPTSIQSEVKSKSLRIFPETNLRERDPVQEMCDWNQLRTTRGKRRSQEFH